VKIKDQVQFTHIPEIFVKNFNKWLHHLEDDQFVLVLVDDGDEIETGESFIHYFKLFVVQEIAHLGVTSND